MTAAQVYTWVPWFLAGSRKGDMDDCLMACHMRYILACDREKGPVLPFTLVRGQLHVPTNKNMADCSKRHTRYPEQTL